MQYGERMPEDTAVDLARECLYRFLGAALGDPYADAWHAVLDPQNQRLACEAGALLRADAANVSVELCRGELSPTLLDIGTVVIELQRSIEELRAGYDRVFGLVVPRECPPYETEYHPTSETFFRSQELADIAGFYRAFGLEPAHDRPERPDHIALELEFMAFVLMKKRLAISAPGDHSQTRESVFTESTNSSHVGVCEEAAHKFFGDHIAWWVPAFVSGLRRKAAGGFYGAVADVLATFVPMERARLGISPATKSAQPDLIERPEEQSACATCPLAV